MGRVRVKNVDVTADDADEIDDYDDELYNDNGEPELSKEDEEQMQAASVLVRERLGNDCPATLADIRETLWYYYYDVDESVTYLQQKYTPKAPKPRSVAKPANQINGTKVSTFSFSVAPTRMPPCSQPLTAAKFFEDTPWLRVPRDRLGEIFVEPLYPRGGLMGGSSKEAGGKQSKLAALAASRKKAQEDKKAQNAEGSAEGSSTGLLDRLGKREAKRSSEASGPLDEPRKRVQSKQKPEPEAQESQQESQTSKPTDVETPKHDAASLTASPSSFATTVLGIPSWQSFAREDDMFTLPYPQSGNKANIDPFSGPSPDDVVLHAQSKASKSSKTPTKKTDVNHASQGVATMKIEDTTRVKSKNLDVQAEFQKTDAKKAANFVVIGHVDHGKSTLMGRLLYDLKLVNERSLGKLQKEADSIGKSSFALAWVMDSTSEERTRGVTVDIATNYFETARTRFTILDAPGHRDFIPNMIAGTSQADFAVLVIDASPNAFESGLRGQTKEHALLARSMGISRLIVAINKMDNAHWSEARYNEISQQTSAFLTTAGFQQKNVAFVPCAGLTGENVLTRPANDKMAWYKGPTLVEALDSFEPAARAMSSPLRLTISDVFRGGPQNALAVTGRIEAGTLQIGDTILAQPSGETGAVKGIEVDGAPAEWSVAGQITTLYLVDIDQVHLRPGDIICAPADSPMLNVRAFTAKVLAFEHLMPSTIDVHRGRTHTPARLTQLLATLHKSTGEVEKKKPRIVKPGAVARIKVELERPLPLEKGTKVVLRAEGGTLGAGLVEEVVGANSRSQTPTSPP